LEKTRRTNNFVCCARSPKTETIAFYFHEREFLRLTKCSVCDGYLITYERNLAVPFVDVNIYLDEHFLVSESCRVLPWNDTTAFEG
jgi:uncharacterized protein with PIN domain